MSEWRECKLKEIAEFNPETLTVKNNWKEINYLDTGNITRGVIDTLQFLSSDGDNIPSRAKRIVRSNDIVYSTVRPNQEHYGLIKVPAHNMIVSTGFTVMRAKNAKCDSGFLYYFMTLPDNTEYLSNVAEDSTTAYPSVKPDVIMDMDILLPLVPEQKAIAEALSSLDDKIDLLNRQNKTLEALAETYFRQWFIEGADENWEVGRLGNLFDVYIGRTPPRKEFHWFSTNEKDFTWISIKDMNGISVYANNSSEFLTKAAIERFNIPQIRTNTVILSFKLTVGRVAIANKDMYSNEAIAQFRMKKDSSLYSEFLYLYLKIFNFGQLGSTSSIAEAVNSTLIKGIEIPIPDNEILKCFYILIKPIFEKIRCNTMQIQTLQKLRDTILPKLINGEVKVKM